MSQLIHGGAPHAKHSESRMREEQFLPGFHAPEQALLIVMAHPPESQHAPLTNRSLAQAEQAEPIKNVPPFSQRDGRLTREHVVPFGAQHAPLAESQAVHVTFGAKTLSVPHAEAEATRLHVVSPQQAPATEL